MAFAKSLHTQRLYEIVKDAERVSAIVQHRDVERVTSAPAVRRARSAHWVGLREEAVRASRASDRMSRMKHNHSTALETQMFVELVAKVKIAAALESGVLDLKCPCGMVILPPTPVISNLKDRQRGLMKSRIERHLRERHGHLPNPPHGFFEQTIREVLKQAFAGN